MTGPRLLYDPHARDQMAARRISEADVEAVLGAPRYRRPSHGGREELYGRAVDGRTLRLVVVAGSQPPMIITVMPFSSRRLQRLMAREEGR
jgi:hypothetical protein